MLVGWCLYNELTPYFPASEWGASYGEVITRAVINVEWAVRKISQVFLPRPTDLFIYSFIENFLLLVNNEVCRKSFNLDDSKTSLIHCHYHCWSRADNAVSWGSNNHGLYSFLQEYFSLGTRMVKYLFIIFIFSVHADVFLHSGKYATHQQAKIQISAMSPQLPIAYPPKMGECQPCNEILAPVQNPYHSQCATQTHHVNKSETN